MKNSNEKYFLITLKSLNGFLSIHEQKKLKASEYHPLESIETREYQVLVKTTRTTGKRFYSYNVFEEPYTTYVFQTRTFPVINDFKKDGFEYDEKGKVVLYGILYGIYAVQDGKDYKDVISGKKIPSSIIDRTSEMKTKSDFKNMLEDLEIIQQHKEVYLKIVREATSKLLEGAINQKKASRKYLENYNQMEKELRERNYENVQSAIKIEEKSKTELQKQRERVKKMIDRIKKIN